MTSWGRRSGNQRWHLARSLRARLGWPCLIRLRRARLLADAVFPTKLFFAGLLFAGVVPGLLAQAQNVALPARSGGAVAAALHEPPPWAAIAPARTGAPSESDLAAYASLPLRFEASPSGCPRSPRAARRLAAGIQGASRLPRATPAALGTDPPVVSRGGSVDVKAASRLAVRVTQAGYVSSLSCARHRTTFALRRGWCSLRVLNEGRRLEDPSSGL